MDRINLPKVLIAIPMKNNAKFLSSLEYILLNLDYPRDKLSLSILESDSDDGTWEKIQSWQKWEGKYFTKVYLRKHDFHFNLSWDERHNFFNQNERIRNIGLARDMVLEPLTDEEFVFMIDADIQNISNKLKDMVKKDLPILCLLPLLYDEEKKLRVFNGAALASPFAPSAYYEEIPEEERNKEYPLKIVSTTAFLFKAKLIKEGVSFAPPDEKDPSKPYWEQAWFAERAEKLGYFPILDPRFAVLHGGRLVNETEKIVKIQEWLKRKETQEKKGMIKIQTWKVPAGNETIQVATIEQGPRRPSMCEGCPAPCSCGSSSLLNPILTAEEFLTNKFPFLFGETPEELKKIGVKAPYVVVLEMKKGDKCQFFDEIKRRCKLWPNCPAACKAYDCRLDDRPSIREFARKREKLWKKKGKLNGRNS